jgi:hypothetical protein
MTDVLTTFFEPDTPLNMIVSRYLDFKVPAEQFCGLKNSEHKTGGVLVNAGRLVR